MMLDSCKDGIKSKVLSEKRRRRRETTEETQAQARQNCLLPQRALIQLTFIVGQVKKACYSRHKITTSSTSIKKPNQAQPGCTKLIAKVKRKTRAMGGQVARSFQNFRQWEEDTAFNNGVLTLTEYKLQHLFERAVKDNELRECHLSQSRQHQLRESK